uniref:Cytochrome P450 n=1 Tax=Zosterops lateralis melanops TaxID=1220523 RepID=A0A8D2QUC1_ZOSLA
IQRYSNILLIALPRLSVKDTELLGYHIPKVQMIKSAEKKENPRQFRKGGVIEILWLNCFFCFFTGHRVCMGELLARMELFIVFSTLLQAFTFTLPEGGVTKINTEPRLGGTLQPHPYRVCAIPQKISFGAHTFSILKV